MPSLQPQVDPDSEDAPILSEINITPLTDVFLVLLIIFMVGASTAVDMERRNAAITKGRLHERALQVQTPEGSGDSALIPRDVVVSVLPDGSLFVNAEEATLETLGAQIEALRVGTVSQRVVVRGDESASYKTIMQVINRVRAAGISDVALSTRAGSGG
jgi:biopolymer transport protein ExbD